MPNVTHRILIVDDDTTTLQLMRATSREAGMECDAATNGADAMAMIGKRAYAAVITDIYMPEAHGHSLIGSLMEREDRPMVIAVTAIEDPLIIKYLIRRGIDELAFKPMNYALFAVKVSALLDRRSVLAEC